MNLVRTRPVSQLQAQADQDNTLKRALTATNLTMLGIGGIIGTGIFVHRHRRGTERRAGRNPGIRARGRGVRLCGAQSLQVQVSTNLANWAPLPVPITVSNGGCSGSRS